jgi:hypothetical protein
MRAIAQTASSQNSTVRQQTLDGDGIKNRVVIVSACVWHGRLLLTVHSPHAATCRGVISVTLPHVRFLG